MISFEEQVANVRQHLASIYERESNWKEAASVLVGIPLETGQKYLLICTLFLYYVIIILTFRKYTVDYKLETYMKIARLYLEDDDPMLAESYINRASLLQV